MIPLKTVLDVVTPASAFTLLMAVGLDLTAADFARVREIAVIMARTAVSESVPRPGATARPASGRRQTAHGRRAEAADRREDGD